MGMGIGGNRNRDVGENVNGNEVLYWERMEIGMGMIPQKWREWEQHTGTNPMYPLVAPPFLYAMCPTDSIFAIWLLATFAVFFTD